MTTKIDPIVLYEIYCRDCGIYLGASPRPLEEYQFALCPECRKKARLPSIIIPFTEEEAQASLEGRKRATSRTKKYGDPGDTFFIKDVLFEITAVTRLPLSDVFWEHYKEEGFENRGAFKEKWETSHPSRGFDINLKVWMHEYRRVE